MYFDLTRTKRELAWAPRYSNIEMFVDVVRLVRRPSRRGARPPRCLASPVTGPAGRAARGVGRARLVVNRRRLLLVVVGVVPTLLLGLGVVQFTLNHFFARAPYLLDSGWYSAIIYRAGLFPHNPQIACNYADYYFGIHFSPLVSAFSLASYLVPLDRIEWYALFQGLVFVPCGIATYLLASRLEPDVSWRRLSVAFVAAIAFAFNGLIVSFVSYPHYEAAIPGLICVVLVAVTTGRLRLAWVCLVLCVSVREDAGFHASLALAPLLYLQLRGVEFPVSRRALVTIVVAAFAASLASIAIQHLFFHPAGLVRSEYLGEPIYSHVDAAMLADRAREVVTTCQHIWYPFVVTCAIAAIRRDARYLLGWAVTAPWLLLNFLAVQQAKAAFFAYTGFPFVVAMFWVYLHGARLARRRLRPIAAEAVLAVIALASLAGALQGQTTTVTSTARDMALHHPWNRATLHRFVDALGERRTQLGKLYVDPPTAALAIESIEPANTWRRGTTPADVIVFQRGAIAFEGGAVSDLVANRLDACTVVIDTKFVMCARDRRPVTVFADFATTVLPAPLATLHLDSSEVHVDGDRIVIDRDPTLRVRLGTLAASTYELSFEVESAEPLELEVATETGAIATASGSHTVAVTFASNGKDPVWYRLHATPPIVITGARLR